MITFRGTDYVAGFQELAAISTTKLGAAHGNLAGHRGELIAALDLVLTGS